MKKIVALMCILALTVQLTACGSGGKAETPQAPETQEAADTQEADDTEKEAASSNGDVKFATIMVTNNDWAMKLAEGGEEACASCISQGVTGLYIQTVDSQAIAPILKKAAEAGIYVFTMTDMEEALNSYDNCFFADYDHKTAGANCADAVAEALDGKGKVGIIAGLAGEDNTTQRSAGFRAQIEENYSDIEVVNEINCDWDRAVAMNAAEDMITGNSDIGAFYCMGEEMAWGVLEAVQNSGKDIKVVTIDASSQTVQMVMDGEMYACIGCPPKSFSAPAVDMMNQLLAGESLEKIYPVAPTYMTKENASFDLADY